MKGLLALPALGVLLSAAAVYSDNPAPRPEGPPPVQREAWVKDGLLVSQLVITEYTTEKRLRKVKGPDGKEQDQEYTVGVPRMKSVEVKLDPKKAQIRRADGKAVSPEELAKLLEKPGMVMFSSNYEKVDPFYLRYLKPETLIVVPERPVVAVPIGPKS